ncbi:hypothetical protein L2E82_43495 [Cichorium intybus]|uniref:Uncharacterized protein n=1 Tax=Cichorium intybus TaxID=13427 RepID=A0ACB8ZPN4_CICIN|nr:hypothetical protein L2E82_43495 [Cichorium intybus]
MYKFPQRPDDYKPTSSPSSSDAKIDRKIQMGPLSYTRVRRKYYTIRGFRLNPKRFYVQRLRAKFCNFFKNLMVSWRSRSSSVYEKCATKGLSQRNIVTKENAYRLRSFGRSNSFYSEAIEDCLEFIRRSSVSSDDKSQS